MGVATLQVHRSNDVEGTGQHFMGPRPTCQIMYFLVTDLPL